MRHAHNAKTTLMFRALDELRDDATASAHLSPEEIDRALDPAGYLGSADEFVARVLARYRAREDGGEAAP